jgi:hypothetical protein
MDLLSISGVEPEKMYDEFNKSGGVSPSQASPTTILKVDLYETAIVLEELGNVIARGGVGIVIASQSGALPLSLEAVTQIIQWPFRLVKLPRRVVALPEFLRSTSCRERCAVVEFYNVDCFFLTPHGLAPPRIRQTSGDRGRRPTETPFAWVPGDHLRAHE